MATTPQEDRIVETARLDGLIASGMEALRLGDAEARMNAARQLVLFSEKTLDEGLAAKAKQARLSLSTATIDRGLQARATIAAGLSGVAETLDAARQVAATGKKELFFPRLQATAATMLETVTALKEAADKVQASAGGVQQLGDVPQALKQVADALQALKDKTKGKA